MDTNNSGKTQVNKKAWNKKNFFIVFIIITAIILSFAGALVAISQSSHGTYGNIVWEYKNGTLLISGQGKMTDIDHGDFIIIDESGLLADIPELEEYPWEKFREKAKEIVIKEGVTSIAKYAFVNFTKVEKLTISKSVTKISEGAFSDASSLKSVVFEEGLIEIQNTAFDTCASLKDITFPETLTTIGKSAFRFCLSIEKIKLPDSVTELGAGAFAACKNLKEINIGKGLKILGTNPFSMLPPNSKLTIDENNPYLTLENGVVFSKDKKILVCYPDFLNYQTYTIPKGVEIIKEFSFSSEILREINTPNTLKIIENEAFILCHGLEKISIAENVKTIFPTAFTNSYLREINVSNENPYFCSKDGILFDKGKTTLIKYPSNKKANVYEVEKGISKIEESAFRGAEIQGVILPFGVTKICKNAFGLSSIQSIGVPKSIEIIEPDALKNITDLKEINYEGSKKQWCQLTGLTDEKQYNEKYIVECSDGTLENK